MFGYAFVQLELSVATVFWVLMPGVIWFGTFPLLPFIKQHSN